MMSRSVAFAVRLSRRAAASTSPYLSATRSSTSSARKVERTAAKALARRALVSSSRARRTPARSSPSVMTEIAADSGSPPRAPPSSTLVSSSAPGTGASVAAYDRLLDRVELGREVRICGHVEELADRPSVDVDLRPAARPRRHQARDGLPADGDGEALAGLGRAQHGGDVVAQFALGDDAVGHLLRSVAVGPVRDTSGMDGERLGRAVELAARLHGDQKRKGTEIPYVAHLLAVAALVLEQEGGDEDDAVAAVLHDAVEDAGGEVTLALIERDFGARVARIVRAVSDRMGVDQRSWRHRKA